MCSEIFHGLFKQIVANCTAIRAPIRDQDEEDDCDTSDNGQFAPIGYLKKIFFTKSE